MFIEHDSKLVVCCLSFGFVKVETGAMIRVKKKTRWNSL